jgi:hypothetical protein
MLHVLPVEKGSYVTTRESKETYEKPQHLTPGSGPKEETDLYLEV